MKDNQPASLCGAGRRSRVLLFVAASFPLLGCLDLTVPPNVGEDASPDARPADAVEVMADTGGGGSGGQGSGGQPGSGGSGASDASGGALGDARRDVANDGRRDGTDARDASAEEGTDVAAADGDDLEGEAGGSDCPGDTADDTVDAPDARPDTVADTASDIPPLLVGLVMYYPCDEVDGTSLRDRSGNGNHGTLQGSSGSSYRIENGKLGNGLTLVQSGSGYVSLPPAVFQGATDLTIASWIKPNSLASWQRILDVGINANLAQNTANGTVYMALFLKNLSNKLGASSTKDGFSTAQQVLADTMAAGTWKHLAVVLTGGAATLYIDGTAMSMVNPFLAPQALGTLDYAFLGKSQFTGDPPLDAQIDEFRVYNRALSANEVQALFQYAGASGP